MRILREVATFIGLIARMPRLLWEAARLWRASGSTVAQRNRRFWAAYTLANRCERGTADRLTEHAGRCVWLYGLSGSDVWDLMDVAAKAIEAGADEAAAKHEMRQAAELWAAMNDVREEPEHAQG